MKINNIKIKRGIENKKTTTQSKDDRLVVSFCLIAYNQEKYIKEAVYGTLSQTYSPLEVIISDDCSSDKTFEIMQEEVEQYKGPHRIVLRRNQSNLGLAEHINVVFSLCSADWIVVAAGDDVSLPTRCEKLVRIIHDVDNMGVLAIQGGYYETDPNGEIRGEIAEPLLPKNDPVEFVRNDAFVVGATMVYNASLFNDFPKLQAGVRYEDRVFAFRSLLRGRIVNHSEALVYYRRDVPNSLSTGDRLKRSLQDSIVFREKRYVGLKHVATQYLLDMEFIGYEDQNLRSVIEHKILEYDFFAAVFGRKPFSSIKQMWRAKKSGLSLKRPWYWLLFSIYCKIRC